MASKRRIRLVLLWWNKRTELRRQWSMCAERALIALHICRGQLLMRGVLGEWALAAGAWRSRRRMEKAALDIGRRRTMRAQIGRWADIVCEKHAARAFRYVYCLG